MLFARVLFCVPLIQALFHGKHFVQIPALGRQADIGDYYDIHNHKIGHSLLDSSHGFPPGTFTTQAVGKSISTFKLVYTSSEVSRMTELNSNLEIAAYLGSINLQGSSEIAHKFQIQTEDINGVFEHRRTTAFERINVQNQQFTELYSPWAGGSFPGTHVIIGITWGVNIYAGFHISRSQSQSASSVELSLNNELGQMSSSLHNRNYHLSSLNQSQFTCTFYSDIPLNKLYATSLQDIQDVMNSVPIYLSNSKTSKGTPLYFHLLSVQHLNEITRKPATTCDSEFKANEIPTKAEKKLFKLYRKHQELMQDYFEVNEVIKKNSIVLPRKFEKRANSLRNNYLDEFKSFNENVAPYVYDIRKNYSLVTEKNVNKQIKEFNNHVKGPVIVKAKLKSILAKVVLKLNDIRLFKRHGVVFIPETASVEQVVSDNFDQRIYVLFVSEDWRKYSEDWKNRRLTLLNIRGTRYLADCDHDIVGSTSCRGLTGPRIHFYSNGVLIDPDFVRIYSGNSTLTHDEFLKIDQTFATSCNLWFGNCMRKQND